MLGAVISISLIHRKRKTKKTDSHTNLLIPVSERTLLCIHIIYRFGQSKYLFHLKIFIRGDKKTFFCCLSQCSNDIFALELSNSNLLVMLRTNCHCYCEDTCLHLFLGSLFVGKYLFANICPCVIRVCMFVILQHLRLLKFLN